MADYSKIAKKIGSFLEVDDWAQAFAKKGNILEANKAINPIENGWHVGGMMSGVPRTISNIRHADMKFTDAIKQAHKMDGGGYDPLAIAGSYIGVSAAYRIASGGGLTRDAEGNPNIIGIPFV